MSAIIRAFGNLANPCILWARHHAPKFSYPMLIKGPFVSGLERPGTILDLEPFDILYWAGNVPDRSRPGMPNRTSPKVVYAKLDAYI